jgi:hypothetical protein
MAPLAPFVLVDGLPLAREAVTISSHSPGRIAVTRIVAVRSKDPLPSIPPNDYRNAVIDEWADGLLGERRTVSPMVPTPVVMRRKHVP